MVNVATPSMELKLKILHLNKNYNKIIKELQLMDKSVCISFVFIGYIRATLSHMFFSKIATDVSIIYNWFFFTCKECMVR